MVLLASLINLAFSEWFINFWLSQSLHCGKPCLPLLQVTLSCILCTWTCAILGSRPSTMKESCPTQEQQRKHSWMNKLRITGNFVWINEKINQKHYKLAVLTHLSNFPPWPCDPGLVWCETTQIDMGVSCLHHSDVQWADLFKQWAVVVLWPTEMSISEGVL